MLLLAGLLARIVNWLARVGVDVLEFLVSTARAAPRAAPWAAVAFASSSIGVSMWLAILLQQRPVVIRPVAPTKTVTITAHPTLTVTATPKPAPTITKFVPVAAPDSNSPAWIGVAAVGGLLVGIGTLALGLAAVVALRRQAQPSGAQPPAQKADHT
jgi:uncharacterized membrane protein YedE/YeeE